MFCIHTNAEGTHNEEAPSLVTGQNQQHHVCKTLLLFLTRSTEGLRHGADVGEIPSLHNLMGKVSPGDCTDIKSSRRAEAIT